MQFIEDKNSFIGIKPKPENLQKCRFSVIPIPYEKTTSYGKGTKNGPKALINASAQVELYDDELNTEVYRKGIVTLKPLNCSGSAETVQKNISKKSKELMSCSATPFFIGGEHSITPAIVKPLLEKYKDLSVLHFDAHADLRPSYEGSKLNHACAMHEISRNCRVVQVGIRSVAAEEYRFVNKGNVKTFRMQDNLDIKNLTAKVLKKLTSKVYISIDLDGFDPCVIPATGTPEPGGFGWYDALYLFRKVCAAKKIAAVDLVELSPVKQSIVSEFTAAKFLYKLMGYITVSKKNC